MSAFVRKLVFGSLLLGAPGLVLAAAPVDINTADAATLAAVIKGVGQAKAEAIVAFRDKNGPFRSIEELSLVQGIGERTVEQNRELLSVGTPAPAQ